MSIEYKITCALPEGYDAGPVLRKLPSPMKRGSGEETYNFRVKKDGFYLIDHLNERATASKALQLFLDEALKYSDTVEIYEP